MRHQVFQRVKLAIIPTEGNNWRPEILSGRFLVYYLVFIVALKLFTIPLALYFQDNIFFADITKTAILEFINKDREALGLQSLKENSVLDKVAMLKAQDMMARNYFAHQSPDGVSPWYWFRAAGYNYNVAGENLAIGFLDSDEVYEAWMDSAGHKANILNAKYRETGIAVLRGDFNGYPTTIVVNLFGKPLRQAQDKPIRQAQSKPIQQFQVKQQKEAKITAAPIKEEPQKIQPKETPSIQPASSAQPIVSNDENSLVAAETAKAAQDPAAEDKNLNKSMNFVFLNFMAQNYYGLIQRIIYLSLIFIIIILLVNIFIKIDIQHPDLIFKAFAFVLVLIIFYAIDKTQLTNLIPHYLIIS